VTVEDGQIAFRGPLKQGANARKAGEDVEVGDVALKAGRRMTPADLALMSAVGLDRVEVFRPLTVAVLSTGDELVESGQKAGPGQIYDANRPMLLAMLERFGFEGIDMGRIADDREVLRAALDEAATRADVIVTSGGASAGDEDHVSALLKEAGALQEWRIALKPGRPLALALWGGKAGFGLPGNPVAARQWCVRWCSHVRPWGCWQARAGPRRRGSTCRQRLKNAKSRGGGNICAQGSGMARPRCSPRKGRGGSAG